MNFPAKIAIFLAVFISFYNLAYSQIDPLWEYFHYKDNGVDVNFNVIPRTVVPGPGVGNDLTVDIRLTVNERKYELLEGKTFSFRKNNGVLTDSYYGMAGFTSTHYTQGQLRETTYNKFLMNYRLLFPINYPTNPEVEGGYPLIVMIHGLGERGNAGYWANSNWNPNDNNPPAGTYRIISAASVPGGTRFTTDVPHLIPNSQQVAIFNSSVSAYNGTRTVSSVSVDQFTVSGLTYSGTTTADVCRTGVLRLLNNDHNLLHGGNTHQTAVRITTPLGMVPNNPNMPARAFPGFVLFPQNLVGWQEPNGAENVVRIIRLLIQKYNINPNKIYIHGLSDGGAGAYRVIRTAPWLFAAVLPMSAVNDADIRNYKIYPYLVTIPQWIFQGGTDGNPTPAATQTRIQDFRNNGMSVRYQVYPTQGHGIWNSAYAEPDFFSWMRSKDKSNIHVKFGTPSVCSTSGAGAELILSQGFRAYQWEKDGVIISGATTFSYTATLPGTYRARFSRVLNPGPNDWNRWSDPVIVTESAPAKPTITASSSTIFATQITGATNVVLKASPKNTKYYWYRNGSLVTDARTFNDLNSNVQDTLSMIFRTDVQPGSYTAKTADISGCQSQSSNPVFVGFSAVTNLTAPSNFTGSAQNAATIFLSWNDNSLNETGFEIWRKKEGETNFTLVAVTPEDAVAYLNTNLSPGTTYLYKIRAIGNNVDALRSNYVPSSEPEDNLEITTPADSMAPTSPQNLKFTFNTISSISISWDAGTDNTAINRYRVNHQRVGTGTITSVFTPSNATNFTITGLTANSSYSITVQAEDLSGNLSPPSNLILETTYIVGLNYEHSTGAWTTLVPSESASKGEIPPIDWVTAEFTGKINNFNVNPINVEPPAIPGIATQEDFYKIKFDGYLQVPVFNPTTTWNHWQFRLTSDDGSMLYIGGFDPANLATNQILNNNGIKEDGPVSVASAFGVNVTLAAAPSYHRIVVLFNEFTEEQSLTVEYRRKISDGNADINYTEWAPIPHEWLRSGNFTPPAALAAPTSLTAATAPEPNNMTRINLSWIYGLPAHQFEVYRSLVNVDSTYSIIGRSTVQSFTDNTVLPGRTYYYKLKTVNPANGATSPFSASANATTASDGIAPSVPTGLTLIGKSFSNVVFNWAASTDNVAVSGYEILINNIIVDSTAVTSYVATGLAPGTLYNFTVKAFDTSGNRSEVSSVLAVTTNPSVMYYSNAITALNQLSAWNTQENGTGTAPASFANNGQFFMIKNRPTTGLGGPLTIGGSVSKLIVPAGTTLNVDNTISAKLEVQGNGVVNLNNTTTAPEFLSISPSSTVNFIAYTIVPAATYGNVNLTGTGNKNFEAGETVIMGNLTATNGIALKGAPSNASSVTVHGDITLAGTPGVVATDNALDVVLAISGTQTVTVNGALDLFKLSTASGTNVNVASSSAITLNVGSPNGGGLELANGTTLNLGTNHLVMKNAATINAGGQTGKLAISGSNLTLNSSSAQNSNLYLDNVLNIAGMVTTTFSSTGDLMIQSPLRITDGLKIKAGEVNSGGNITLVSTDLKTAYLQELEGNGSITGAAKVERWVSAARKYRYMSSVVENMTVALWQQGGMNITGPFTGTSGSQTPSMFYFHEPDINPNAIPPHNGYNRFPVSANSEMLQRGRGYSIFNYSTTSLTLTMTGKPYQGSVSYTLTPGMGGNDGWNLVGNPYASAIQWNNLASDWTKSVTGLSPVIHVPDNTDPQGLRFKTWNANTNSGTLTGGIIAPGQAFWVQTVPGTPSLTIHEKAKRNSSSTFYREGESTVNSITIKLSNGTREDEAYIIVGDSFEDSYEPGVDAMKLNNQVLNLSTLSSENVKLIFNNLSNSFCEKTVPLSIDNVTPGTYSLSFDNLENLVGVGAVELTDHFTNTTLPLTGSTPYSFSVTTDAATYGAGRFSLTLHRPALTKNAIAVVENVCGGTSASIQLTNTQPGVFYYASLQNDETPLSETMSGNEGSITLTVPVSALQTGSNHLVIHTGFKGCSNELLSATPLEFTYTPSPEVSVDRNYYSLCKDSQITLNAVTSTENNLRWYKDGELLTGRTESSWLSDPIKSTTLFEVAAVVNGCEGKRVSTYVEINDVPMPLVDFVGEALEIVNEIPANVFIQWYKDNTPLDAYDRGFKPAEEGIYTVLASKAGCSQISEPFEFLVTRIENKSGETLNAYVYPNPATHNQLYIKLETPSQQVAEVVMVDLHGRKVFEVSINGSAVNGVHKLNVAQDTAPGLYLIQIRQGEAVLHRKLMLNFE